MQDLHMPEVTTTSSRVVVIPPSFQRAFAKAVVRYHRAQQTLYMLDPEISTVPDFDPSVYLTGHGEQNARV